MRPLPIALVLAGALALTACGSSGGDADGSATATASAGATAGDGGSDAALATADTAGDAALATGTAAPATGADSEIEAETADDAAERPAGDYSCTVLTAAEISEATGLTFAEGAPSTIATGEFQDACDWTSNDGMATAQVIIVDQDVYDMNKASAGAVSDTTDDIEVAGTDAAYSTFNGSIIGMRIGDRFVQFAVIAADTTDRSQAVVDLATLVADRV